MTIPSRPPYYEGDPFYFEEFKVSARAFFEQSGSTEKLMLQQIRDRIKVPYVQYRLKKMLTKCNTVDDFLNLLESGVYDPEYVKRWFVLSMYRKGRITKVRFCATVANQAIGTRVETLRVAIFSDWFAAAARAVLPSAEVERFEASIFPQVVEGERSRLFIEFLSRINPPLNEGRDLEEKGPQGLKLEHGHLQYGNDPRGLATPKGVAGEGDPEEIATPVGTTPGMTQRNLGTLDSKVQRHRARIEKDRDA